MDSAEYVGFLMAKLTWPLLNSWMFVKFVKSNWVKSHVFLSVLIVAFISDYFINPFMLTTILALTMLVSMIGEKFSKKKEVLETDERTK